MALFGISDELGCMCKNLALFLFVFASSFIKIAGSALCFYLMITKWSYVLLFFPGTRIPWTREITGSILSLC